MESKFSIKMDQSTKYCFRLCSTIIVITCLFIPEVWSRMAEHTEEPPRPPLEIVTTTTTTAPPPPENLTCFHRPPEYCPTEKERKICDCKKLDPPYNQAVICCNINNLEGLSCAGVGATKNVTALHIRNASLDILNFSSSIFKRLDSLSVTDGTINKVMGDFTKHSSIACLNLSNNGLSYIESRIINVFNLTTLDLSHNKFENIPSLSKAFKHLSLDISDNKKLQCKELMETIKNEHIKFMNKEDSCCQSSNSFHWFNSTDTVPFNEVVKIYEINKQCPEVENIKCTCHTSRLEILPGQLPKIAVKVDCSNRNISTLPEKLPSNTIVLNISNNSISSIKLFSNESTYQHIRELYADHNEITSIDILEGTKFIDNFRVLSLRANKLKRFQSHMLSNMFDRSNLPRRMYLGLNELECTCNTAKTFKQWLLTKIEQVPDKNEIKCANLPLNVMELDENKECQQAQVWTDYINYLIGIEIFLLIGLIVKVSYDYWIFKTTGHLPWPASNMPKLPCDWLCET